MKFLIAVLPVIAQYLFEELRQWWAKRDTDTPKKRMKEMREALKDRDIDRVNRLFNATKRRR